MLWSACYRLFLEELIVICWWMTMWRFPCSFSYHSVTDDPVWHGDATDMILEWWCSSLYPAYRSLMFSVACITIPKYLWLSQQIRPNKRHCIFEPFPDAIYATIRPNSTLILHPWTFLAIMRQQWNQEPGFFSYSSFWNLWSKPWVQKFRQCCLHEF